MGRLREEATSTATPYPKPPSLALRQSRRLFASLPPAPISMLQPDYLFEKEIRSGLYPVKAIHGLPISPGMNPSPFHCLEVLSNPAPPNSLIPSPTSPAGRYALVTLTPLLLLQYSEHMPASETGWSFCLERYLSRSRRDFLPHSIWDSA